MRPYIHSLVIIFLSFSLVTATFHHGHAALSFFGKHKNVKDIDGEIHIPVADIDDTAHYYRYKHNGHQVKFFIVKSRDGVIRAAFDACDICFSAKKGYSQDGDYMICNNCNRKFHSNRINVEKGGCNPAPLARKVSGDTLTIATRDIIPGIRFF